MKISQGDNKPTSALSQSSAAVGKSSGSATKQVVVQQPNLDHVQLSNISRYLADAIDGSPAHLQMLSDLQNAVGTGQYHVDPYLVSGSVIQNSLQFSGEGYANRTS